jgi:hypothetical protein
MRGVDFLSTPFAYSGINDAHNCFDGPYYIERDRYQGYRGRVRIQTRAEELRHVLQTSGKYMHPWYVNLNELPESVLNPITAHKSGSVLLSVSARFGCGHLQLHELVRPG